MNSKERILETLANESGLGLKDLSQKVFLCYSRTSSLVTELRKEGKLRTHRPLGVQQRKHYLTAKGKACITNNMKEEAVMNNTLSTYRELSIGGSTY